MMRVIKKLEYLLFPIIIIMAIPVILGWFMYDLYGIFLTRYPR